MIIMVVILAACSGFVHWLSSEESNLFCVQGYCCYFASVALAPFNVRISIVLVR